MTAAFTAMLFAGFSGQVLPGVLCASLFPALIGSNFPGAIYLSQTLKFRAPALVRPLKSVILSFWSMDSSLMDGCEQELSLQLLVFATVAKLM